MKKRIYKISKIFSSLALISVFVFPSIPPIAAETDKITAFDIVSEIKIGWNLGNTLDCYDVKGEFADFETAWGNPKTTQKMINAVKSAGFGAVRIPVTWNEHTNGNRIDEAWLLRVKEVADYVINSGMYAIINLHHDDYTWLCPSYEKEEAVTERYAAIWAQIADYFRDYDYRLIFEAMNEPRISGGENEWSIGTEESRNVVNRLTAVFVKTVRNSGGENKNRFLIVAPHAASSEDIAINAFEIPDDERLIVSVHYYFPYELALSEKDNPEWGSSKDKKELEKGFDRIKRKFIDNGIPVIIGEFGATFKENNETRKRYFYHYIKEARKRGIPCFVWDNGNKEEFGFLNREACTWWHEDVITAATDAATEKYIKLKYRSSASIAPQVGNGDIVKYEGFNGSAVNINSETGEITAVSKGEARIKCTVITADGEVEAETYLVKVYYTPLQLIIKLLFGLFGY